MTAHSRVSFDDESLVTLKHHQRAKHVRIKVLPPGQVVVVAPLRFDRRHLPAILEEHRSWLEETLQRVRLGANAQAALSPPARIELPALEREWAVHYREGCGQSGQCREGGEGLRVTLNETGEWRGPLRQWLMRQARSELVPWLETVSTELGLPFSGVTIRGQKTRWGSCSAKRHINLNYRLLFLAPDLVRYLFVHELCHTVHLNHSSRFWALVAECQPHYKIYDKALRRAQQAIPAWALSL